MTRGVLVSSADHKNHFSSNRSKKNASAAVGFFSHNLHLKSILGQLTTVKFWKDNLIFHIRQEV